MVGGYMVVGCVMAYKTETRRKNIIKIGAFEQKKKEKKSINTI